VSTQGERRNKPEEKKRSQASIAYPFLRGDKGKEGRGVALRGDREEKKTREASSVMLGGRNTS